MSQPEELQEAKEKVEAIFKGFDLMVHAPEDLSEFLDKDGMIKSGIDQILSLKGEGWHIGIISDRPREIGEGGFPFKQVIWPVGGER